MKTTPPFTTLILLGVLSLAPLFLWRAVAGNIDGSEFIVNNGNIVWKHLSLVLW